MLVVAHADWGVDPRKQWVSVAERRPGGRWVAQAPRPVGRSGGLRERLVGVDVAAGVPALLGFDFPIGVPRGYAELAGTEHFPAFLDHRGPWRDFFEVADAAGEIALHRPFYPRTSLPAGSRRLSHLTGALWLVPAQLRRRCDAAYAGRRAACPLFWTCGANQVGKGALAGWRLLQREACAIWPFDGPLPALLGSAPTVVAEAYPAEFYGHLGLPGLRGKRRQQVRAGCAARLARAAGDLGVLLAGSLAAQLEEGFGADGAGEDRFDSFVGLLGTVAVVEGRRGEGVPRDDPSVVSVEGWILGQAEQARPAG